MPTRNLRDGGPRLERLRNDLRLHIRRPPAATCRPRHDLEPPDHMQIGTVLLDIHIDKLSLASHTGQETRPSMRANTGGIKTALTNFLHGRLSLT